MNFAYIRARLTNLKWLLRLRPDAGHLRLGRRGERRARRYLVGLGHRVLARNYTVSASGEIDLITRDGDTIVFTEVKTRTTDDHQPLDHTVSREKWHRVERAARGFLAQRGLQAAPFRFDLVLILWPRRSRPIIEHVPDAYRRGE